MYKQQDSETWVLDWRFTNDELFESNRLVGDKQQIVADMVDSLAGGLALEYAIDPTMIGQLATATFHLKELRTLLILSLQNVA